MNSDTMLVERFVLYPKKKCLQAKRPDEQVDESAEEHLLMNKTDSDVFSDAFL